MDNQHRKIIGYRELSEAEIALMNDIKQHAEKVGELVAHLELLLHSEANAIQNKNLGTDDFLDAVASLDQGREWAKEGRMDLKRGFMALTRAVARPTTF